MLPLPRPTAAATHKFSCTVNDGKICATWNEREIPSRVIARDGSPVMSLSSKRIEPFEGWMWPVIILTKVVLPAPLAPMMPTVCSAGTSSEIARAAMNVFAADGLTIQQFNEPAGGQVVFHLHMHVMPRHNGVALLPPASRKEDVKVLEDNATKLIAALG